jgi:hypothetical protein
MPDLNQMVQNLKNAIILPGPVDDGMDGDRGPIIGTGDTYEYLTYLQNLEVNDGGNGSGSIKYSYKSRQRHKHYVAQNETATQDKDINGQVIAKYDFTFTGKVLITGIENQGKSGRSGNCIEYRLQSANGMFVG